MSIPVYHGDAFTGKLFAENPAAVCPSDGWLPDELSQTDRVPISDQAITYSKGYLNL